MNAQTPSPSQRDPTPQRRLGDASIKPAVIAFFVTILIILVAAIIFIKARQTKVIPKATTPQPTTQMTPPLPMPVPFRQAAEVAVQKISARQHTQGSRNNLVCMSEHKHERIHEREHEHEHIPPPDLPRHKPLMGLPPHIFT